MIMEAAGTHFDPDVIGCVRNIETARSPQIGRDA